MLVLPGCGGRAGQDTLSDITALYASADRFDSRISIRVELPDRTMDYVIDWQYDAGRSTLTVVEPLPIAGIACETDDSGLTFRYADAVLQVDPSGEGVSPLEAPAELLFGWSGGLVQDCCPSVWNEEEALAVTYSQTRGADNYTQRVWFDPERLTPLCAELYEGDTLALTCEFLTFQINP